jgi:alpha-tubulin suppressor-like RCC1 family protein
LDSDGNMYASGWNTFGQYPMAGPTYSATPLKTPPPPGATRWTKIAAGEQVSLAVDDQGRLFSWGLQGSTGSTDWAPNTPKLVNVPETGWLDISVGKIFALALSATGKLYFWGLIPGSGLQPTNVPTRVRNVPDVLSPTLTGTLLSLDNIKLDSGSSLVIDVVGPSGASFKIESSPDLIHWEEEGVGMIFTTVVHHYVPAVATTNAFFRVTSPGLAHHL